MADDLEVKPGLVIPASDLVWRAVRSSGPGGQNVNRVSTKVELAFDLAHTRALDVGARARLARSSARRIDTEGRLVVVSQSTRSQAQNLEDARQRLAALIRAALVVPKRRKATRPSKRAKEKRLEGKRRTAEKKQGRKSVGAD
jgi:ribosome-associated protein